MTATDGSSGCWTRGVVEVRVIDVATAQFYRFNCPNCGSKLEAECRELTDIGGKVSRFYCPVCNQERYISWGSLRKRTVYENRASELH